VLAALEHNLFKIFNYLYALNNIIKMLISPMLTKLWINMKLNKNFKQIIQQIQIKISMIWSNIMNISELKINIFKNYMKRVQMNNKANSVIEIWI